MRYGSVCSGIEAATVAWHTLGWEPMFFSEIEPFPCAVLKHYYPDVPNLGDMTKFKEWPDAAIDILVGGTPCQSFSVAGLRKGLADPRGNLMLTFGAIAQRYRPRWLVWENVPGVLSSNGGRDFGTFLDMLEELGYIVDCDILDAQFNGVPQRRRRVFVCGQHRDYLLKSKTDSSALIIAQCWLEILHGILASQSVELGNEQPNSDSAYLSRDGVHRRMKLFGLLGETSSYKILRENLIGAFLRLQQGQDSSDAHLGEKQADYTQKDLLMDLLGEDPSILTAQMLKVALDGSYAVMKSFITSTETNSITTAEICSCSLAVLLIGRLIPLLNQSSPPFWSAASSALTVTKEFMNYARQASSYLFEDMDRISYWVHFIRQAEQTIDTIGNIRVDCFGEVFPVSESLLRHPAPSREKGKGTAARVARSLTRRYDGSEDGTGRGLELICMAHGQDSRVISCINMQGDKGGAHVTQDGTSYTLGAYDQPHAIVMAHGQGGAEIRSDGSPSLTCNHEAPICFENHAQDSRVKEIEVASLHAKAGTGVGNLPIVLNNRQDPVYDEDLCQPLGMKDNGLAVAFKPGQGAASRSIGYAEELAPTLGSEAGGNTVPAVAFAQNTLTLGGRPDPVNDARMTIGVGEERDPQFTLQAAHSHAVAFIKGDNNGSTQETNAGALLRILRKEIGEEAFAKWVLGILDSLQPKEILRQALHGSVLRPAAFSRSWVVYCSLSRKEGDASWLLQSLRETGCPGCPPQGWEPSEQLTRELGAYLSGLSQPGAQVQRFMHDMWSASEGIGLLRQALSEIQEVGRSAHREGQSAHQLQVRRLTATECEFLQGFPRGYTNIPWRNKPESPDGPRYKALGNSMAVPVMRWIGERIQLVENMKMNMEVGE